jgi:hypothetical protein
MSHGSRGFRGFRELARIHAKRSAIPTPRIRPLASPPRHRSDCTLCGSSDVRADEAHDGGLWLLGECGRCGHRWTAGPFDGPLPAPAMVRPVPSAAEQAGISVA